MATKQENKRPETGWGEKINAFFQDNVVVRNYAVNGYATLNFRTDGYWNKLLDQIHPGDYVMIQFGHNDQKQENPKGYSAPEVFRQRLEDFATEVRARHGHPILITSVTRWSFEKDGTLADTLADYTAQTRAAAEETGVPLIDLSTRSREKIQSLGVAGSEKYYLHLSPGESPNYPNGVADNTHLSDEGACMMASLVAAEIVRADPEGLALHLKKQ